MKERLSDIVIHSYFKYQEEPQVTEGFDKIFKVPFVPNLIRWMTLHFLINSY